MSDASPTPAQQPIAPDQPKVLFATFLKLGLTSFGGPTAHIGFFRKAFVEEKRWLTDRSYAELVALCQTLPGPASSQVGLGIGYLRGGVKGALAAWAGFTLPSAVIMALFAMGVATDMLITDTTLRLMKVIAAAVVFDALMGMAPSLAPDWRRRGIALLAIGLSFMIPGLLGPMVVVGVGAMLGFFLVDLRMEDIESPGDVPTNPLFPKIALAVFMLILIALPLTPTGNSVLDLFERMFRVGTLVFGGGHVVLPLMTGEFVDPGYVSGEAFVAGYGAAQGVPGPMFTLASFLGVLADPGPGGALGAFVATIGVFLPSFLLVIGLLPYWAKLGKSTAMRHALGGINAAVLGLLAWAFVGIVLPDALGLGHDGVLSILFHLGLVVAVYAVTKVVGLKIWHLVLAALGLGVFL